MTMLDFESLYRFLNLSTTCLLFCRFLIKYTQEEVRDPPLFRDLVHLICHDSFFKFKGLYYRQITRSPNWQLHGRGPGGNRCEEGGVPIRTKSHSQGFVHTSCVLLYTRYVDNIFVLRKNQSMTKDLEEQFSKKQYGLKLKKTQESKEDLNYLAIKIIAKRGQFDTTVYRKPINNQS